VLARPAAQAAVALPADIPRYLGALIRAGQSAGAALALLDHSITYARDRRQFGRPLAQFQVIQHNLARLAGAAATMNAAASAAFRAAEAIGFAGRPGTDARLAIAIAKCRTAELTETVTAIAHQVHGAIGFTAEHSLHFWTRRLWSWRGEFGAAGVWAERLGSLALRRGPERIWNDLSALIGR
jgi:acyl-CoA dehydrogenase